MARTRRRDVLAALALALAGDAARSQAAVVRGALPWMPDKTEPPRPVAAGAWQYFTADEAMTVEALVDRLIPPDPETPGGKDAGCAVFIDRQLAGPYGQAEGLYDAGHRSMTARSSRVRNRRSIRRRALPRRRLPRSTHIAGRTTAGTASPISLTPTRTPSSAAWRTARSSSRGDGKAFLRTAAEGYPARASSPTRSMAAIATWPAGG